MYSGWINRRLNDVNMKDLSKSINENFFVYAKMPATNFIL